MDIVITRYIGIRGTAILARSFRERLLERLPEKLLNEACAFDEGLPEDDEELPEDSVRETGGVFYLKAYDRFGIHEALFRLSKELRCGLDIELGKIPVKQETVEICEALGANPYALYSGYSSVIACEDGGKITEKLEKIGIPSVIVGKTNNTNDKYLINKEEKGYLPHIRVDELERLREEIP